VIEYTSARRDSFTCFGYGIPGGDHDTMAWQGSCPAEVRTPVVLLQNLWQADRRGCSG
jgi:hypothetical protein